MRKGNTKIIEIAGIRGLLTVLFIGVCLAAGFIMFPAKVLMYLWNTYVTNYLALSHINIWQGLLLWAAIALTCYIANGKRFLVSCYEPPQLNEEEMKILMERIKIQAKARKLNAMLMKQSADIKEITVVNEENNNAEPQNSTENTNENKS